MNCRCSCLPTLKSALYLQGFQRKPAMDRVAQLRTQLAATSQNLSLARARVRAERKKQGREDKKNESAWRLSEWQRHVLLIIYALAGFTATPAMKFLASDALRRKWPAKSEEELQVLVEGVFLDVNDAELNDLCYLPEPRDPAAAKEAVRWSEEWRVAKWIQVLNDRGVAPPTASVLERFEQQRQAVPEGVRPDARGSAAETRGRMYARRFRARWGAKHQRIRPREDLTPEEMRQKAGRGESINQRSSGRKPGWFCARGPSRRATQNRFMLPESGFDLRPGIRVGKRARNPGAHIRINRRGQNPGSISSPESGLETGPDSGAKKWILPAFSLLVGRPSLCGSGSIMASARCRR